MDEEFDDKRVFIASVLLSGILANVSYNPPRHKKMDMMCEDAVNFADCLINKLQEEK